MPAGALGKLIRVGEVARCALAARHPARLAAAYMRLADVAYPYTARLRRGAAIELLDHSELTTFWHVFFGGEYRLPERCETIVDLGANIGCFSLFAAFARPGSRVIAVEPFPDTFARLQRNLAANLAADRAVAFNVAVAAADGTLEFDGRAEISSYCRHAVDADFTGARVTVPAWSLGHLLDAAGMSEVDMLKIDIEGGEYDLILRGDDRTLRRCRYIALEYHGDNAPDFPEQPSDLIRRLTDLGYDRRRHEPRGWSGMLEFERRA